MFSIIKFLETNDVAVIPSQWVVKGKKEGWWPPYKDMERVMRSVKNNAPVDYSTWSKHSLRVLKEYDSYDEARPHLKKAEYTSNLESEGPSSPLRRTRKRQNATEVFTPVKKKPVKDTDEESSEDEGLRKVSPPPNFSTQGSGLFCLAEGSGTSRRLNFTPQKSPFNSTVVSTPRSTMAHRRIETIHTAPSGSRRVAIRPSKVKSPSEPLESFIVKSLERLHQKSDLQGELIVKIIDLLENSGRAIMDKEEFSFLFPMASMDQVDVLEQRIQNAAEYKKLVNHLAWFGGSDYKENLRRLLSHLFTDELALQFAWEGIRKLNPKRPFKDLKLKNALFDAVKKNRLIKSVTENELKIKGASWFQHASDRIKAAVASATGKTAQRTPASIDSIPDQDDQLNK